MSNISKRMVATLLFFPGILCLSGCDIARFPEKVEGLPNTFRREPLRRREKVLSVLVRGAEGPAWLIMAVEPIDLKDFKVRVGVAPKGFEQMIPTGNREFTPVVGTTYSIAIMTDVRNYSCAYVLQMSASWTAEE